MSATAPNPILVKTRSEGLQLVNPLQSAVTSLVITDADDYLDADGLLGRVNNAIAKWDARMSPILTPLSEAIKKAKEAMEGAKGLDSEVRTPLNNMVTSVKLAMKDYKVREARQIADAKAAQERETQRIRDEAAKKALQATTAVTSRMRAKLDQMRADLEAQAEAVEEEQAPAPIKGGASTTRTTKKVRIADPVLFLSALRDYKPRAGVYEMEHPPLTILTTKTDRSGQPQATLVQPFTADSAMGVVQTEVSKIYSSQPGVVKSWPGVEEYDDIVIASR